MDDQKKKSNQDYEQYVEVQIAENLLTASVRCTAIEEVNPAYKDVISLLEKKESHMESLKRLCTLL
ncbi:hypothetical protein [Caldalkalibacillus mannanilyticus]|uniref:hypothetical protein n=1 Tax=Caldalkalibacillus mannanilyticus TaxID=1418 RepID=UPI000687CDA1|nr:hypothetical protein [Caldalkalibacillus mannanilyticus]